MSTTSWSSSITRILATGTLTTAAQRLGFLLGVPGPAHDEHGCRHPTGADALPQVQALGPGTAVADLWHDQVQQNEIEPLPEQDVVRVGDGIHRGDLVRMPVTEGDKERPEHRDHDRLVIDDEDSLRHVAPTP